MNYYQNNELEKAIRMIFLASGYMFNMNQVLYDEELENLLARIAAEHLKLIQIHTTKQNVILYYDSFGQMQRGMTQIYIKALCRLGYCVKYVTFEKYQSVKNDVHSYIKEEDIFFIHENTCLGQMQELLNYIYSVKPGKIFMHLMPDDVIAVGAFSCIDREIQKYQINLTDHAFWLGKNVSDVIINFRSFGAKVCRDYRGIGEEKNVYLPYYPVGISLPYLGLDFSDNTKKIIFSGGNLYKTQSPDGIYYRLVSRLLETYDINFAYFGAGDARQIRHLCKKFPGRIIFSRERADFFEVMKKSSFYLSTYPYNGGLMTQYALLANKIPLTLQCHGIEPELSVNHEKVFWNYDTVEAVLEEAGKLLNDEIYRQKQEEKLHKFLINEDTFTEELQNIITYGISNRGIQYTTVDISGFVELPRWYYRGIYYDRLFFRRGGRFMIRYFPLKYIKGMFGRMIERVNNGK